MRVRLIAVFGLMVASLLNAPSVQASVTPPTQPLLLAFHSCSVGAAGCMNPANHYVQLAQGTDGANWTLVPGWQTYQGSVPDVFRRGDTIYVYSTSGVTRINAKTGEVTSNARVQFTDGSGYVDPSLAQLPDGRLIMFYLPGILGIDPAGCGNEPSCVRQIRSAVEVAGSDGTQFVPNPNPHISVELTRGSFSDPDSFFNGSQWVLYVSRGPSTEAYTSGDIQGQYSKVADVTVNQGGVPAGLRLDSGEVLTLVSRETNIQRGASPTGVVSLNGAMTPTLEPSIVAGAYLVASPGLAANTQGIALPASISSQATTVTCRKGKVVKEFSKKCRKGWRQVS